MERSYVNHAFADETGYSKNFEFHSGTALPRLLTRQAGIGNLNEAFSGSLDNLQLVNETSIGHRTEYDNVSGRGRSPNNSEDEPNNEHYEVLHHITTDESDTEV